VNKSTIEFISARDQQTQSVRRVVQVLGLAALAILILACTNIASLLVVRTAGRQTELSVRAALGASAARLRRQLLVEHVVLSIVAAGIGIGVAAGLLKVLALTRLISSTQIERASLGWPAIAFLIGLAMLSATSIGWVVSRRASRSTIARARGESSSKDLVRLRQLLVGIEVGAAAVLLAAATLLLQSAARLLAVDHGFEAENVVKFQVGLPAPKYAETANRVRFIDDVVGRLQQLPGVRSAAAAGFAPMTDLRSTRRFAVDGKRPAPGTEPLVIDVPAGPTYAETIGLRLTDGRWISATDRADSPPVVVVSQSFARQYFPGERAIGHRVDFYAGRPDAPPPPSHEIVGVVSDVRQFSVAEAAGPTVYVPLPQRTWSFTTFFVRTISDPRSVMGSLPAAVRAVDPERAVEQVQTLSELVANSTADRRALSVLLAAAALVALLISTIGVYGVAAATTAARRRELAIRAAIGADRARLLALVLRQGLVAATIGVGAGILTAVGASSVLAATLYEVQPRDPITFISVAVALLVTCWIASYIPARRAVTASPSEALRAE
jgi:predicted permease